MVWYAVPPIVFAGICMYVGFYHLRIYLRRPKEIENLSFATMTLLMVIYYVIASQLYNADSLDIGLVWSQLAYISLTFFASAFVFFVYHLTERKISWLPYTTAAINIVFCALLWLGSPQYTFSLEGAVPKQIEWLNIIYYDPTMGIIVDLFVLFLFSLICFLAFLMVSAYKSGKKYLLPAIISISIFFIGVINDMMVTSQFYTFMYLMEFGFIAIIVNMAYTLLNKFVGLYQKVELQTKYQVELNNAFRRFVPYEFISFLNKESIIDIKLGDQVEKKMTVLFADIRSFTALSESMSAEENFNFLNSYLKRVGPVIRKNNGFIDKYIGDAIMALFPDCVDDAVNAAIEIRNALFEYNEHRKHQNYDPIDVGIGIHTGTLMLGTIGESQRMEGTVISDAVNLAARLESSTKKMSAPIIISKECTENLKDRDAFNLRFLGNINVKGKSTLISLHEVMNSDPEKLLKLKLRTKESFEHAVDLISTGLTKEAEKIFTDIYDPANPDPVVKMQLEKLRNS